MGWLRISDDDVRECGIETVIQEGSGAFMVYYERVVSEHGAVYGSREDMRASEETLKPKPIKINGDVVLANGHVNSSIVSLPDGASVKSEKVDAHREDEKAAGMGTISSSPQQRAQMGARIVRSVSAQRTRHPPEAERRNAGSVGDVVEPTPPPNLPKQEEAKTEE